MLFQLPRESRVFAAVQPATQWGWSETFQNKMVYLLETIVWQNATPTKAGERAKHKTLKPELYVPPFMPKRHTGNDIRKGIMASDTETIKDLLSRPRK